MNLINHETEEKNEKLKKVLKTSIIFAIVLFLIILVILIYFMYKDSQTLKLSVDRKNVAIPTSLFVFDSNKIYVSIKDIAKLVGYEYFNGDYKKLTEDQDKCYLNNKKEISGFTIGSNQMYKADPTGKEQNYDWYTMDEPVKTINQKLYATSDAIETACNLTFTYDQEKNTIYILTLNYWVPYYEARVVNNYGYSGIDNNYNNQKALLQNMIVVKKEEGKDKFKYGVISNDNRQIIGVKYDAIEYIEVSNDFYVTTNKKMGVSSSEGAQKIEPNYDVIKVLDNDLRLYYVKNNNLYGVLDRNGKRVVYIEYNQIGLDTSLYPSNEIKNNMLLFENCIPVMKNNMWGLIDKNGNVLQDTIYDSLGYVNGTRKNISGDNLLVIPSIEGIVVCKDKLYGIVNSTGKLIAPCRFDSIYVVTNLGESKYYLEWTANGNTEKIELEEYLKISRQTEENNAQTNKNVNQIENYNPTTDTTAIEGTVVDTTTTNSTQVVAPADQNITTTTQDLNTLEIQ